MSTRRFFVAAAAALVALNFAGCKDDDETPWEEEVSVTTGNYSEVNSYSITIDNNKINYNGHNKSELQSGIAFSINGTSVMNDIKNGMTGILSYDYTLKDGILTKDKFDINLVQGRTVYFVENDKASDEFSVTITGLYDNNTIYYAAYCRDESGKIIMGDIKEVSTPSINLGFDLKVEMIKSSSTYALATCTLSTIKEIDDFDFYMVYGQNESDANSKPREGDDSMVVLQKKDQTYYIQDTLHVKQNSNYYLRTYAIRRNPAYPYGENSQVVKSETVSFKTPEFKPIVKTYDVEKDGINVTLHGRIEGSAIDLRDCKYGFKVFYENNTGKGWTVFDCDWDPTKEGFISTTILLYRGTKYKYVALAGLESVLSPTCCYGDTVSFETDDVKVTPNVNDAVDLGLSVKWAPYDLGTAFYADKEALFAWGEIETKETYNLYNYKYYVQPAAYSKPGLGSVQAAREGTFTYSPDILDSEHDAATQVWGENWRMPTIEEFNELFEKCKFEYIDEGYGSFAKVIGPNGNYIYMRIGKADIYMSANGHNDNGSFEIPCFLLDYSYTLQEFSNRRYDNYCWEGRVIRPVLK